MEIISITGCGDRPRASPPVTCCSPPTGPGVMMRLNAVMVPVMLAAMWFVAPHGIVWVAVVHLVTAGGVHRSSAS